MFDLRDDVGTEYGGGNCWGGDAGGHGVSFSTQAPRNASWVEPVSSTGNAIRLPL
jgi:hypothetical protein